MQQRNTLQNLFFLALKDLDEVTPMLAIMEKDSMKSMHIQCLHTRGMVVRCSCGRSSCLTVALGRASPPRSQGEALVDWRRTSGLGDSSRGRQVAPGHVERQRSVGPS